MRRDQIDLRIEHTPRAAPCGRSRVQLPVISGFVDPWLLARSRVIRSGRVL